jgi:hypothetical protein
MILGTDWLAQVGPMKVDWRKGSIEFNHKGADIKLQVQEEVVEVKFCEGVIDIRKEKKKESEIVVAHLLSLGEEEKAQKQIHPELQDILN